MVNELYYGKGKRNIDLCTISYNLNRSNNLKEHVLPNELQYYRVIRDGDNYCLIKNKEKYIDVCFKSTSTIREVSQNLNTNLISPNTNNKFGHVYNYDSLCKVHRGYLNAWYKIRHLLTNYLSDQPQNKRIRLTGHSMGGAVSIIAGFDLKLSGYNISEITTFGTPKVGNRRFTNNFNILLRHKTTQFQMVFDPIILFPIFWYSHVGKKQRILGKKHKCSAYQRHFTSLEYN